VKRKLLGVNETIVQSGKVISINDVENYMFMVGNTL
jgi:hypothetical protein